MLAAFRSLFCSALRRFHDQADPHDRLAARARCAAMHVIHFPKTAITHSSGARMAALIPACAGAKRKRDDEDDEDDDDEDDDDE